MAGAISGLPAGDSALMSPLLVLLSNGDCEFTCSGREDSELGVPICCTSGGVWFGGLEMGDIGTIVTGGEVFVWVGAG